MGKNVLTRNNIWEGRVKFRVIVFSLHLACEISYKEREKLRDNKPYFDLGIICDLGKGNPSEIRLE